MFEGLRTQHTVKGNRVQGPRLGRTNHVIRLGGSNQIDTDKFHILAKPHLYTAWFRIQRRGSGRTSRVDASSNRGKVLRSRAIGTAMVSDSDGRRRCCCRRGDRCPNSVASAPAIRVGMTTQTPRPTRSYSRSSKLSDAWPETPETLGLHVRAGESINCRCHNSNISRVQS